MLNFIKASRLLCVLGGVLAVSYSYAGQQLKSTPTLPQVIAICESGLNMEAEIALRLRNSGLPKNLAQNMITSSMRKHLHVPADILNAYVETGKKVVANVYNSTTNEKNLDQAVYQACSKFNGANFTASQVSQGLQCIEVSDSINLVTKVRDSGTNYAAATTRLKIYLNKLQSSHKLSSSQVAEENKIISKALKIVYANRSSSGEKLSKQYYKQCLNKIASH